MAHSGKSGKMVDCQRINLDIRQTVIEQKCLRLSLCAIEKRKITHEDNCFPPR